MNIDIHASMHILNDKLNIITTHNISELDFNLSNNKETITLDNLFQNLVHIGIKIIKNKVLE